MPVTATEEYKKEIVIMKSVGTNSIMLKTIRRIMTIPIMTPMMIMMEHIVIGNNRKFRTDPNFEIL